MGLGGIGFWQLIIVLVIILLLFGTKKLRNLGSDLGGAIKGFKNAMGDPEAEEKARQERLAAQNAEENKGDTYEVKAEKVDDKKA